MYKELLASDGTFVAEDSSISLVFNWLMTTENTAAAESSSNLWLLVPFYNITSNKIINFETFPNTFLWKSAIIC